MHSRAPAKSVGSLIYFQRPPLILHSVSFSVICGTTHFAVSQVPTWDDVNLPGNRSLLRLLADFKLSVVLRTYTFQCSISSVLRNFFTLTDTHSKQSVQRGGKIYLRLVELRPTLYYASPKPRREDYVKNCGKHEPSLNLSTSTFATSDSVLKISTEN